MDKSQYLKIKNGLTAPILEVQKEAGWQAAERLLSGIVATLGNLDSFFDPEAAVGYTLQTSLNGESREAFFESNQTIMRSV